MDGNDDRQPGVAKNGGLAVTPPLVPPNGTTTSLTPVSSSTTLARPPLDSPLSASSSRPLASFDWDDFEARSERALAEADERERAILHEFHETVQYFHEWAAASAAHDNERAAKRLHTRQRFVALQEESLAVKQRHYEQVMIAFQSALALLSR